MRKKPTDGPVQRGKERSRISVKTFVRGKNGHIESPDMFGPSRKEFYIFNKEMCINYS